MRSLFPEIEPYQTFRLKVSDLHELYIEECGNPDGCPVVFLHGGPGGGISKQHRRLFDPDFYRIILFDQRGSGQSTPHAELRENTTWDLVADIEQIREFLEIEHWLVFGGSWGSTLSLAYSETHPDRVTGLVLRGIFLCRPEEFQWFYQEGCSWLFPEEWQRYIAPVPENERLDMISAYYRLLTHENEDIRLRAAQAWSRWEGATCHLIPDAQTVDNFEDAHHALAMARIECHYFINNCFFKEDSQLLRHIDQIHHIPTWIIHGRYDAICPARNAFELKQAFPEAYYHIIPDAGHAFNEPGILDALISATEEFKTIHTEVSP